MGVSDKSASSGGVTTSLVKLLCIASSVLALPTYDEISEKLSLDEITKIYQDVLTSSNNASDWLKTYTQEQHLAGQNYHLAEFTAQRFEEFGFKAKFENFSVYINYPVENSIKVLEPNKDGSYELTYQPTLVEDELEEDPTTSGEGLVPAFHGYSANGNVTAELVFANYGTKEDFALLAENNIDLEGKIVIVRYGGIFRGLKVKFAQEAGALGVITYSDPADDYSPPDAEPYPKGPGRNPSSIQRGSVQFLSSLPGDPSRFTDRSPEALANLTTIPRIPSLPISYKEAIPILETLNGYGSDLGFKGGVSTFNYTTGPSSAKINLYNNVEYDFTNITNVYGLIEGEEADKVVIIGNHRDAWVKGGAGDPNSGSAVLLELARGFNELFKQGYKPRYSILLASWDGEEYALLGSTSYAEKYAAKLDKQAVGYINVDVAVGGTHLELAGSPLFNQLLLDQGSLVTHPDTNVSLTERFLNESEILILGSGSDYTTFYEHLGIPSIDLGFNPGLGDPVYHYHSNYDSYHWISTFADPGFKYHNALAQYLGLLTLKLTEEKLLKSYSTSDYASAVAGYFSTLVSTIPQDWLNQTVVLDDDIIAPYSYSEDNLTSTDVTVLRDLITATNDTLSILEEVAKHHDEEKEYLQSQWDESVSTSSSPITKSLFDKRVATINDKSRNFEKQFLYEGGLKSREWFKHIVYASGRYTGYAGQSLPGLTEALEDDSFDEAARWIHILQVAAQRAIASLV